MHVAVEFLRRNHRKRVLDVVLIVALIVDQGIVQLGDFIRNLTRRHRDFRFAFTLSARKSERVVHIVPFVGVERVGVIRE